MKTLNKDIAAFLWILALAGASGRAQSSKSNAGTNPAETRALLNEAKKARNAIAGKTDQERIDAIRAAIAAYDKVRTTSAGDGAAVGEAAFRLGELYLRLKDTKRALETFNQSFEQAKEKYGARALMEIAHVERRSRRLAEAITAYQRVEKEFPEDPKATDARLWIGKTELSRKAYDEARKSFSEVASSAKDPVDRIEGFDWLARSFLREQRIEDAEAALRDADDQLGALAASDEPESGKVRRALERMGARASIARLRAKEAGEAHDEEDEEEEGGGKGKEKSKGKGKGKEKAKEAEKGKEKEGR